MYYEWDAAKARRIFLIKFAIAWFAAIALAIVPLWVLVEAATV